MNAFANTLFSVLFSGIRSMIEGIWAAAASGRLSRFFSWLGDYWLIVVAVICAGATCMDYLVWLIRWRPYLVWRTKLRRLFSRPSRRQAEANRRFARGYQGGVNLDISDTMHAPREEAWDDPALWEQPAPQPPVSFPDAPYADPGYAASDAPADNSGPVYGQAVPAPNAYAQPESPYAPPTPVYQNAAYYHSPYGNELPMQPDDRFSALSPAAQEEPPEAWLHTPVSDAAETPAGRNPRRGRAQLKKRFSLHERLTAVDEEEEGMLDGLPPVVDREQAFHEPVYPNRKASTFRSWTRPEQKNGNG
ncbi:MAG: hypothetical protein SOX25_06285 [Eubacteriales bacterium]|nr:hypothetical protein [Eubacteriales bacterium]